MLGNCFFTYGGEYTGEPVWEGEKGVAGFAPDASNFTHTNLGSGYSGSFSITGNTLRFTSSVIPEPSAALGGLLLTAGLLRRRRNQGLPVLPARHNS